MARKSRNSTIYNANVAILAGDSFRKHAHIFLSTLGNDINVAHIVAAGDVGGLISSATTLALAVELYLKAHTIIVGLPVAETHHLWTLYKSLPEALKGIVESNYNKQNPTGGSASCGLEVAIDTDFTNKEEVNEWSMRRVSPDTDSSLKAVLVRSSDAFKNWRYLHEHSTDSKLAVLKYEYMRLDLIAHLLRDIAVNVLHSKSLNRNRGAGAPLPG